MVGAGFGATLREVLVKGRPSERESGNERGRKKKYPPVCGIVSYKEKEKESIATRERWEKTSVVPERLAEVGVAPDRGKNHHGDKRKKAYHSWGLLKEKGEKRIPRQRVITEKKETGPSRKRPTFKKVSYR